MTVDAIVWHFGGIPLKWWYSFIPLTTTTKKRERERKEKKSPSPYKISG